MTDGAAATALMNRVYRRQRHIYDVTRKYYLIGRDRLIADLAPAPGDNVLEIGCGTGRNLILAAQAYPQARFFGLDVSTVMLTTAIEAIAKAGLSSRARLAHGDAARFDPALCFGVARFERVFMSYSLSMMPAWQTSVAGAIELLRPGGELHIVDFGGQEGLPRLFRSVLRLWLTRFHVAPRDGLQAELAMHAARMGARLALARPYRGYAQYAVFKRP